MTGATHLKPALVLCLSITTARTACAEPQTSKSATRRLCAAPWRKLDRVHQQLTRPEPLILLQLSFVPPILFSPTGVDHELRRFAQTTLHGSYNPEPFTISAPYVTIAMSGLGFGAAALTRDCNAQRTTSAIAFALFETVLFVGLEKWVVGRAWPTGGRDPYAADRLNHPEDAQDYAPFSRGIDAAWPSGHTASMFAAAAALRASSPQLGIWRYAGYPFAVAVGLGMWWGDHHWASDVLSGAMIGEAIGGAAGRAWAPDVEKEKVSWFLVPSANGLAISASGTF